MLQARFRDILHPASPRSEPASPTTGCVDGSEHDLSEDLLPAQAAAERARAMGVAAGPGGSAGGVGEAAELQAAVSAAQATIMELRARERELEQELDEARAPASRCYAPLCAALPHRRECRS